MSNVFRREPIEGGDSNSWASFLLAQTRANEGLITGQLYNDGGDLKVPACKIGINDGTNRGICEIDTIVTVNLAGVSNETWAKIEMTVSGTSVAFAAADIAGATDPTELPSEFKNSFNGEKGGFYIDTDKRCIGLAWLNGSGVLLAIINVKSHEKEWWASQIGLHTGTIHEQAAPGKGFVIPFSGWDMDTAQSFSVTWYLSDFARAVGLLNVEIRNTAASTSSPLNHYDFVANTGLTSGGTLGAALNNCSLFRRADGDFDNATYAAALGNVIVHMRDF